MKKQKTHQKIPEKKPNKYHAVRTETDGITFDSKLEAKRYSELMLMLKAGEIEKLRLQQQFTLQDGFKTHEGTLIRPVRYVADFTYFDSDGNYIIEDTKSEKTRKLPEYRIKKRLMAEKGYMIKEILI